MWPYILVAALWAAIIIFWLIPVARRHLLGEVFASLGIGIFFSLVILVALDWGHGAIRPMVYAGYALFVPAAALVVPAFVGLGHRGRPESGWEPTTQLVESGIYRVVRDPLYLGSAVFVLGEMLIIQSVVSAALGAVAILCFWMASRMEVAFNLEKFGNDYRGYMERVPMWNIVSGLLRLGRTHREA